MLAGIEFIVSAAAIALGIGMFVVAMRRRPSTVGRQASDDSTTAILRANVYSLSVIALIFFGISFLIDTFM